MKSRCDLAILYAAVLWPGADNTQLLMKVVAHLVWRTSWIVWFSFLLGLNLFGANDTISQKYGNLFSQARIPVEKIIGTDSQGIPVLCGSDDSQAVASPLQISPLGKPPLPPPPTVLPSGMRSWECVPSVIRADGVDFFRLEVDVNGVVSDVVLTLAAGTAYLNFASGPLTQNLHDDGLNGDRIAGDRIFTSERIIYSPTTQFPQNFFYDSNSPAGLHYINLGFCHIIETNGVTNDFLLSPIVGLLNTNVPLVEQVQLATNVMASPHLVNVLTGTRQSQKALRQATFTGMNNATTPIYSTLPDGFDFIIFFSVDHAEYLPDTYRENFVAGAHNRVRVNYTGTGLTTGDSTAYFGSGGRLLGVNILDVVGRGIDGSICTHEILHQWASFTSGSLGLTSSDGSHYSSACSAMSLVGGSVWTLNTDGTYTKDCGADSLHAPPLDKYMMGLIWASNVPPLYVDTNGPGCYRVLTNYRTVTISDIQAVHGVRTPNPAASQKNFSLCFAAESFGRFLTPAEMTFYDVLAGFYTKPTPEGEVYPGVGGWHSIDQYFGEGSKWSSDALDVIRPKITLVERITNGTSRISGNGYPSRSYRLLGSTNLQTWISITNEVADTNGAFVLPDNLAPSIQRRFYRVVTP